MIRRVLLPALSALLLCQPVCAREVSTRTWVEDGVTWTETTVVEVEEPGSERLVGLHDGPERNGLASFGPFEVLDGTRAALVAETDSYSPADFSKMLRAYPGIRVLEMADCPGTVDDFANLRLGRMIRAQGIATHVPDHGSVRSGAVELFLAGASRSAAPDASFVVHAWIDEDGREPDDFAADASVNRAYVSYYREMGLADDKAAAFYALTNSVPNEAVLMLGRADMARFAALD
ncbi:hypothetical protein [Novosphingobium sp. MMS21-SN21R]|uniref:hypothetical protein n=1 Tax=Novosphingobium sp. MMS21-SN21R TaxID=2969298 RepID=UPI0028880FCD|nr:hypothetical protein [Novosphingobium sp. MMS21-SN21R]MDT0506667.1 hypothetical protein [Novosphingobium sp. MMS21-SN21R]